MNREMEAELTEMASKTDNMAVTEEANVDEDIPIDFIIERSTQAYKDTTSMYIDKINTFENRNKANTIKQSPTHEVINEAYSIGSKILLDDFM